MQIKEIKKTSDKYDFPVELTRYVIADDDVKIVIKLWHKRHSDSLSGKNNPCYGRKWMHIKDSSRKEDRIYVKEVECQKYLDLGYIFGMKENNV